MEQHREEGSLGYNNLSLERALESGGGREGGRGREERMLGDEFRGDESEGQCKERMWVELELLTGRGGCV